MTYILVHHLKNVYFIIWYGINETGLKKNIQEGFKVSISSRGGPLFLISLC